MLLRLWDFYWLWYLFHWWWDPWLEVSKSFVYTHRTGHSACSWQNILKHPGRGGGVSVYFASNKLETIATQKPTAMHSFKASSRTIVLLSVLHWRHWSINIWIQNIWLHYLCNKTPCTHSYFLFHQVGYLMLLAAMTMHSILRGFLRWSGRQSCSSYQR